AHARSANGSQPSSASPFKSWPRPDLLRSGYVSCATTACVDYTREAYALSPELTRDSVPGRLMGTFTLGCCSSRTQVSHRRKLLPRPLRKGPVFVVSGTRK